MLFLFRTDPLFPIARSLAPTWATKKYFKAGTGVNADNIAMSVLDVVGGYSLMPIGNVLPLGAKVALIQTVAGDVVSPTANAVALNLIELAKPVGPTELGYDLSNPATPGAWPMCTMLSLTLDAVNPVTTCATKAGLMQFLLWFYTSTTVQALAKTLNVAVIPELYLTQSGLLDSLTSLIKCGGQSLITSTTSEGFMQGFSSVAPLLTAYSNFYHQFQSDYIYTFSATTETLSTERVMAGEIDFAVVNTKQLKQTDVALMTQDQGGVYLPALYTGVVVTFTLPSIIVANYSKWNAVTDTRGGLPQLLPLALNLETVVGIFTGQITSWTDPAILATSPQVGPWFAAHPQLSTSFTPVICCSNTADPQVAGTLLFQALNQTKVALNPTSSKYFSLPLSWSEQMRDSTAFNLQEFETRMTPKSTNTQAAGGSTISYRMITSAATDPATEFRIIQTLPDGTIESLPGQPSTFLPCAVEGWKQKKLTDPTWNPGPIKGCYPLSAIMSFGVGMAFEGTGCDRGNRSLNYFQWINTNPALSAAATTSGYLRVSDVPDIQQAIQDQLNKATCDGETLLITLPTVWKVNAAITGFGTAVMSILLATFVASAIALVVYRQRTVLRSSSVPFLGLILVGLIMLAISIGAWSSPDGDPAARCGAFMWLASFGFSLVFVPFFAKTYRIYLIFSRQKLQVVKLSNQRLFALVGSFFAAELIVMIVWTAVSPLKPVTYFRNISGTIHQATHCSVDSSGMTFVVIEAVYKGLLLVVGSLLAFRTRKVSSNFNESSSIAMSIYSCLFSSVIIGALIYFVSAFEDTLILLMLFLIFWLATVTWALVFGAKFYELFSRSEAEAAQASKIESLQTEKSQGGFSFVSVAAMPIPIVKSYIQALESHLAKAKKQLSTLLGTSAGFPHPNTSGGKRILVATSSTQRYEKGAATGGVSHQQETDSTNDDAELIQEADLVSAHPGSHPGDLMIRPPSVASTIQTKGSRSPNRSPRGDTMTTTWGTRNVAPAETLPRSPSFGTFALGESAEKSRGAGATGGAERKPLLIGAQKEAIEGGEMGSAPTSASASLSNWPGAQVCSTPSNASMTSPVSPESAAARTLASSPPQPVSTALRPSSRATLSGTFLPTSSPKNLTAPEDAKESTK